MKFRRILGIAGALALVSATAFATVAPVAAQTNEPEEFTENGEYRVPDGVCQVEIVAYGAAGGNRYESPDSPGGDGGGVAGTFAVEPGNELDVFVGQPGTGSNGNGNNGTIPGGDGYNSGGDGDGAAGGGGGSSAVVFDSLPLIVAGGGGGGRFGSDGRDGGDGGRGVADGSAASGANAGAGGVVGDPSDGGSTSDPAPNTNTLSQAGGGAGAAGGAVGGTGGTGGAGGGGASNTFGALSSADPGGPYPTSGTDNGSPEAGNVTITPMEPGVGCPESTLEIAKVVSGTSTQPFTVGVACGAQDGESVDITLTATLHFTKTGEPDATSTPAGWTISNGVFAITSGDIAGSTCLAVETNNGGATSVTYTCGWTPGAEDGIDDAGCPGPSDGPTAGPQAVNLEGNDDVGLLTVTNTFVPAAPPTPTNAADVLLVRGFTG